nr:MAG TPA: hypothetical protein [Caudoviricetes sp.]
MIFKPYDSRNAKNEYQVIKEYFFIERCGTDRLAKLLCKGRGYEICGCVIGRRTLNIKVAMSRKFFAMVGWRRKFGVCLRKRPVQFS